MMRKNMDLNTAKSQSGSAVILNIITQLLAVMAKEKTGILSNMSFCLINTRHPEGKNLNS
jgi:hypothetical protein